MPGFCVYAHIGFAGNIAVYRCVFGREGKFLELGGMRCHSALLTEIRPKKVPSETDEPKITNLSSSPGGMEGPPILKVVIT